AGAEFLLVPPAVRSRIEADSALVRHLELHYYAAVRDEQEGLLFDLRERLETPTFTVAICTFRRADLLRGAIESVLGQDYPPDRFEVLVVDNEPSDAARVVTESAASGTVAVSYYVEERNGLSFARNAAVVRSLAAYVA